MTVPRKHATLELILSPFTTRCTQYADGNNWCDKDYSAYVKIKQEDDDDEHGVPFTDRELTLLWQHSENETVEALLILCYVRMAHYRI